jgi:hypothetical protein
MEERVTVEGVEYVVAYPVADGRCPHCAAPHYGRYWTPARIVASVRRWYETHGVAPSRTTFGEAGTVDKPTLRTIDDVFGKRAWSKVTKLAGVPRARMGAPSTWPNEAILDALLDWATTHGRWPQKDDWGKSSPKNPHWSQVIRRFGSWNAALKAAGRASLRSTDVTIGKVDAAPVARVLAVELAHRPLKAVAEEVDVDPTYLSKIVRGVSPEIRADYADRILTKLDHPHLLERVA